MLLDWCHREIPIAAFIFVVIIAVFDLLTVASGTELSLGYVLSDGIQGGVYAAVALVVWRRVLPPGAAPWLWSLAVVVSTWALTYQYRVDPAAAGVGVLVILASAAGSLTLFWRPFLVATVVMAGLAITTFFTTLQARADSWSIVYLTALGASAGLMAARRASSLSAARASLAVEEMATTDALTGLLNRHGFRESAPLLVAVAERSDRPLHAVFVDVGGLKQVNDQHGHHAGDVVLQRTADAVRRASRAGDLVIRWGGDEIVIVGLGDRPDIEDLERRIRQGLDLAGLEGIWPGALHIGASGQAGTELDALIKRADEDLYRRREA